MMQASEETYGDIRGALGTLRQSDVGPRTGWAHRLRTLLAILGPGLIVMVGDNDAGAFSTYAQAGQNYGTSLLWTLALLVPVLYVNQEMVLRLGAIAQVGHAKLILRRFGKFWGAFSVIDLFVLNALTLVTEFIGISLGLGVLGVPKTWGLAAAAVMIMGAVRPAISDASSASLSCWSSAAYCWCRCFSWCTHPGLTSATTS